MLQELLTEELKDLLNAEKQLIRALPKMAKAANDEDLKAAFQEHLEQTKEHAERLNRVFEMLGEKAKSKTCKGMAGIVEEGQETITEGKEMDDATADLALIGAAQRVEHYEIAGYRAVCAMAEQMERNDILKVLQRTLSEEEKTSDRLTKLAQPIFEQANEASEEEEYEAQEA